MQTAIDRKTMVEFAEAVAAALGDPWRSEIPPLEQQNGHFSIYRYEGPAASLQNCQRMYFEGRTSHRAKPGMWLVSGSWPRDAEGRASYPGDIETINISRSKDASQVVKELKRRFLPWYQSQFSAQMTKVGRQNDSDLNVKVLKGKLCQALGGYTLTPMEDRGNTIRPYRHGITELRVSEDRVQIQTESLPADVALKVVEFIAGIAPRKGY